MGILTLGITDDANASSAALVEDGRILSAIEAAKLRSGSFQVAALECCRVAGVDPARIDRCVYFTQPVAGARRAVQFRLSRLLMAPAVSSYYTIADINRARSQLAAKHFVELSFGRTMDWTWSDRLVAHATWAFHSSPFDRAAILVLCGVGDFRCVGIAIGEGAKIRLVDSCRFPNSLGWIYNQVTRAIGFEGYRQEAKVQWLSLTGQPEFASAFKRMIVVNGQGRVVIHPSFLKASFRGPIVLGDEFFRAVDVKSRANVAASLQGRVEEICLALAGSIRTRFGVDKLCLAGGVAENALLVSRLEQELGAVNIYVPPAPGNAGCSIGAALAVSPVRVPVETVALGPEFANSEIKAELDNCKLVSTYYPAEKNLLDRTVDLLLQNNVIAWFQGRAEFGSRALGFRSMLANPGAPFVDENINRYLKHRESFHPFAVSVIQEEAGKYFQSVGPSSRSLSSASRLTDLGGRLLQKLSFRNGLVRVHVVERQTNPLFWRLLDRVRQRTDHPVLINSSLNLPGEPMVVRPRDAIRIFYASGLDALVIGAFVLGK